MAKALREIHAGRLGYAVLYTQSSIADAPRVRAEKSQATTAARQKINLRHSWQQLELLLFANFGRDDLLVTATYDNEHLPPIRAEAEKKLKKLFVRLRACRKKRGQELRYIYVTEDKHGEGRLHHHFVVSGTGADFEELRSLWGEGNLHIQNLRPKDFGYLARYLTKEARESGKAIGKKTWVASQNLVRPEKPKAVTVPDLMTLTVPPNAELLESSGEVRMGEYGSYSYIKYLVRSPEDYRPPREISSEPEEDLSLWQAGGRKSNKASSQIFQPRNHV